MLMHIYLRQWETRTHLGVFSNVGDEELVAEHHGDPVMPGSCRVSTHVYMGAGGLGMASTYPISIVSRCFSSFGALRFARVNVSANEDGVDISTLAHTSTRSCGSSGIFCRGRCGTRRCSRQPMQSTLSNYVCCNVSKVPLLMIRIM